MKVVRQKLCVPGNEDSFNATNGDGAADDDDKLSLDLVFSLHLFCEKENFKFNLFQMMFAHK